MRPFRASLFLLLSIFLAGCVSTQDRYERAVTLQAQGHFPDAAGYYIRVLRKEPGWAEARSGLQETGARAVERFLGEAAALEASGSYPQAVRVLDRLDDLHRRAAGVGVSLAVPDDYAATRERLTEGAVLTLLRQGERAEQAGAWRDALKAYEAVQERYPIPPAQHAELDRARARVYLRWSEQEGAAGRYRAAYDRAQQALRIQGPETDLGALALALQDEVLAAGTRLVALLPFWPSEEAAPAVPRGLVYSLGDVLFDAYWAEPPRFLAAVEPAEVRRALRALRLDRARFTRHEAAEAGRALEVDYVVAGELVAYDRVEADLQEERRAARTRGTAPGDTSYVRQRFTLRLDAALQIRLIDPQTRTVVHEETVRADASTRLERGAYAGDPRDLRLSTAEARLFDPEVQRTAEHELEDALLERLADRAGRRIEEVLLGQIR